MIRFAGVAKNLTTAPRLLDQPASFELRGQGSSHMLVEATVDRRGQKAIDTIYVSCPRIAIPAKTLGDEQSLLVALSSSELAMEVDTKITDGNIAGTVELHVNQVAVDVQQLHEMMGGKPIQDALNQELQEVKRLKLRWNCRES